MKKYTKGFTLIELLVVIAIIGILSSVVLASLNTARGKGTDAAIKSQLNSLRTQATIFAEDNANFTNFTVAGNSDVSRIVNSIQANGVTVVLNASTSAQAWAASAPLKSNSSLYFCVDYFGNATTTATALTSGASNNKCN